MILSVMQITTMVVMMMVVIKTLMKTVFVDITVYTDHHVHLKNLEKNLGDDLSCIPFMVQ